MNVELYIFFVRLKYKNEKSLDLLRRFQFSIRQEWKLDRKIILDCREVRMIQNDIVGKELSKEQNKTDENILNNIFICESYIKNMVSELIQENKVHNKAFGFFLLDEDFQTKLIHYLYLVRTDQTSGEFIEYLLRELLDRDIWPENMPSDIFAMNNVELKCELIQRGVRLI